MRLFIGVELEKEMKNALLKIQNELIKYCNRGNFTLTNNFHLTLYFIGEVDSNEIDDWKMVVKSTAEEVKQVTLELTEVGSFERGKRHIIYMGVKKNDNLLKLQTKLIANIRKHIVKCPEAPYHPHLTLTREAEISTTLDIIKEKLPKSMVTSNVGHITLFESKRIDNVLQYVPLINYSLKC